MIHFNRLFIFLLIASFVSTLIWSGNLTFLAFYLMLSIAAIDFFYAFAIKKFLKATIQFSSNSFYANEPSPCSIGISSEFPIFIPYLELKSTVFQFNKEGYQGFVINMMPGKVYQLDTLLHFPQRGIIPAGSLLLKASDLFHSFSVHIEEKVQSQLVIYPKVFTISKTALLDLNFFDNTPSIKSVYSDPYAIKDISKYKDGDSIKRIHWKVSAKHNQLYVKNLDSISKEAFTIVCDMHKENNQLDTLGLAEEQIIEMWLSLICGLMVSRKRKINVILTNLDNHRFIIDTQEDFNHLLDHMVYQKSDGEFSLGKYLHQQLTPSDKLNKMLFVSYDISEETSRSLFDLKHEGHSPIMIYCSQSRETALNAAILNERGILCIHSLQLLVNTQMEEKNNAV